MEHLKPQHQVSKTPITPDQYGQLHAWDAFLEDIVPQLEADRQKMHAITPFEMRQGEELRVK